MKKLTEDEVVELLMSWLESKDWSIIEYCLGHSSLNVSLTYLRGLEVAELKEEDMPMV